MLNGASIAGGSNGSGMNGDSALGGNGGADSGSAGGDVSLEDDGWNVGVSARSLRTMNPNRNLVQNLALKPNLSKSVITLYVGDPTVDVNLVVRDAVIGAFVSAMRSRNDNGYSLSMGEVPARVAIE